MVYKGISQDINVFHARTSPEKGMLVGYGALIDSLHLPVPLPTKLTLISAKRRHYKTEKWLVFTPRLQPPDTLYGHLVFAIIYVGINLLFFKKLFEQLGKLINENWVKDEPLSQYGRKIWFLYEWLLQTTLNIPDLKDGNCVPLIDEKLQYCGNKGINSPRQRIRNNLPCTVNFCPLIFKTFKIENYIHENLAEKISATINGVNKNIVLRTSAYLIMKNSKASFTIEGEKPTQNPAIRWGKAIWPAGNKLLSKEELLRLQQIDIENSRFVTMGFRTEGGFVGEHDHITGEPIPEHISARWQDLDTLTNGLLETASMLEKIQFHPVLAAAEIAFGFVFFHPFIDGNGRIHRYWNHHLLSKMNYTPQGIIFPVSAALLERLADYRKVLENLTNPLLDFIEWKNTSSNNIDVLNETKEYYSYFDATLQTEFLFECIDLTIKKIIPEEVAYIQKYDAIKSWIDDKFQRPTTKSSISAPTSPTAFWSWPRWFAR